MVFCAWPGKTSRGFCPSVAVTTPKHSEFPRATSAHDSVEDTNALQSWTDSIRWDSVSIDRSFRLERESGNIDGLFKKTTAKGDRHMISYYTAADSSGGWLKTPLQDSELRLAMLRAELNFKLLVTHSSHDFNDVVGLQ